jgi:hypothetical protein
VLGTNMPSQMCTVSYCNRSDIMMHHYNHDHQHPCLTKFSEPFASPGAFIPRGDHQHSMLWSISEAAQASSSGHMSVAAFANKRCLVGQLKFDAAVHIHTNAQLLQE